MEKIEIDGTTVYYSPFSEYHLAKEAVSRSSKIQMIVQGDDERFWVTTPADASILVKAGYEYAL